MRMGEKKYDALECSSTQGRGGILKNWLVNTL